MFASHTAVSSFLDSYEPRRQGTGAIALGDYFSGFADDEVFPLPLLPDGHTQRLVHSLADTPHVEVTFAVQGVIMETRLPPVSFEVRKPGFLRQSIRIGGSGSKTFDRNVELLRRLSACLQRSLPDGSVHPWAPILDQDGCPVLQFSNRYFSSTHAARGKTALSFPPAVDPKGVLARAAGDRWVHVDDNVVEYLQIRDKRVYEYPPQSYRVGDIVEVHFTINPFRHANGTGFAMGSVLRSVVLISPSISRHVSPLSSPSVQKQGFKRFSGFDDVEKSPDVARLRKKMKELTMSGEETLVGAGIDRKSVV